MISTIDHKEILWPTGDCSPILATTLSLENLSQRCEIKIFRDQGDLGWFSGAAFESEGLGPVLIMRHDNNPLKIVVFYVDSGKDFLYSIDFIRAQFLLENEDVSWVTPLAKKS